MIVVKFGFDDTDHHGLADLEGPGGEHAFTLGISALELVAAAHVACSLKDQLYLQADQDGPARTAVQAAWPPHRTGPGYRRPRGRSPDSPRDVPTESDNLSGRVPVVSGR